MPHFTHWSADDNGNRRTSATDEGLDMAGIIEAPAGAGLPAYFCREGFVKLLHLPLCVPMIVLPAAACAEEAPWSGEVTAGYVASSGNSSTRTANGKAELVYSVEVWRNTFTASVLQSSQVSAVTGAREVSAERYFAGDKVDFNLTEKDYVYFTVEFEKDLAGPVRQRTSEAAGYGRKVLTGPDHLLELELGAGARQTREQITGNRDSDAIGRGRAAYRWNLSESSHFGETFKIESGESNTFFESVTELRLSLILNLFATASYTLRQNSNVPPGASNTDTITAISLSWSFGR
jgi:putative salt-induced outer membrane protein